MDVEVDGNEYSDGLDGRCAIGVVMSYYGWNGRNGPDASDILLVTLLAFRTAGISQLFNRTY
jgi:hypothetical protein